ncbi:PDR/VanB family oxidoreductase [Streptomyces sp. SID8352]|uniref:PDR/VanB family oxidoreductase n=1 Tax=Streptomyces sp. SID8352 TaxID=2690338 RepID=UPI00136AEB3A|nr:PDR/VanB family oxidoreductase [Streptomyces sp. SID8352]MYU26215.1 2Fe-2S iron-sulfur cluster binding domain-containing protein [Streptomyces sp. SID8352]
MTNADYPLETHLVVERIQTEADGVVSLDLVSPTGDRVPRWEPGAHIDLVIDEQLERQYSLCGDPADDRVLKVAVLREPESRGGSRWVHESLAAGDKILIRGPRNHFALVNDAQEYLFIAGGIGITPILPMIADCEFRGVPWRLVYGGRQIGSMAFTEALGRYGERVVMWPQDERGHIDIEGFLGEPRTGVAIYCCGPGPLLDAVEDVCRPWPSEALHVERFRAKEGALDGADEPFDVELQRSKILVRVEAGQTIVEAVRAIGVHVPTSCGEGTCGTCETEVLDGIPDHRDSFLTPQERESNEVILPCCSRACTPSLVLDL